MTNVQCLAAIFISLVSANAFGWTGWHPTAWTTPRLATPETVRVQAVTNGPFVFTNYLPQWNQVVDGVYTNYVYGWPPDGSCSTNKVISTNAFLSDIVANAGALDTGVVVNSWSFDLTDCTGTAYTVTRTVTNYPSWTNLYLQASEIAALDCYYAVYERWLVTAGRTTNATISKPRFYRSSRDTLVYLKDVVQSRAFYDDFAKGTNDPARGSGVLRLPTYDQLNELTANAGVPTNYFYVTPYRSLLSTNGGYGSVYTTSYTVAQSYTRKCIRCLPGWEDWCDDEDSVFLEFICAEWQIFTNSISTNNTVDGCGNDIKITGHPGDIVLAYCTNSIQPGSWSHEYGWVGLRKILTNLNAVVYLPGKYGNYYSESSRACYPTYPDDDIFAFFQVPSRAYVGARDTPGVSWSGLWYTEPGESAGYAVVGGYADFAVGGVGTKSIDYFSDYKPAVRFLSTNAPAILSIDSYKDLASPPAPSCGQIGWPEETTQFVKSVVGGSFLTTSYGPYYYTYPNIVGGGSDPCQPTNTTVGTTNVYVNSVFLLVEDQASLQAPVFPPTVGDYGQYDDSTACPQDAGTFRVGASGSLLGARGIRVRWNFER